MYVAISSSKRIIIRAPFLLSCDSRDAGGGLSGGRLGVGGTAFLLSGDSGVAGGGLSGRRLGVGGTSTGCPHICRISSLLKPRSRSLWSSSALHAPYAMPAHASPLHAATANSHLARINTPPRVSAEAEKEECGYCPLPSASETCSDGASVQHT